MGNQSNGITLEEYKTVQLPREAISDEEGELLHRLYGDKVTVTPPSFKTGRKWELTSQGWVGFIPFLPHLRLHLKPKTPLRNLFGMWEYAYRLKSFEFLAELYTCQSLQEFYEQLASILAKKVLDRGRKGYYRAYLSEEDQLPYLRGQINIRRMVQKPWDSRFQCNYQEHTPDISDNQILEWTLFTIARSGLNRQEVAHTVRQAYRTLQNAVSLEPFKANDCLNRSYHRLNEDYRPLHALSCFFLDNSGPMHEVGEKEMMPFLVSMDNLFELFVAEWLKVHLPEPWRIKAQERVEISPDDQIYFQVDLVLEDALTGEIRCVLDTKYKAPDSPSKADIAQAIAYAETIGSMEAILVYPTPLSHPINLKTRNIRVRSMTFDLSGDLEEAGEVLLGKILGE